MRGGTTSRSSAQLELDDEVSEDPSLGSGVTPRRSQSGQANLPRVTGWPRKPRSITRQPQYRSRGTTLSPARSTGLEPRLAHTFLGAVQLSHEAVQLVVHPRESRPLVDAHERQGRCEASTARRGSPLKTRKRLALPLALSPALRLARGRRLCGTDQKSTKRRQERTSYAATGLRRLSNPTSSPWSARCLLRSSSPCWLRSVPRMSLVSVCALSPSISGCSPR